ncbi:response regulator [Oculatella sp. LEGE 06141]|uniref:hybrid sensor histidine kinase/response regulator n=1 Tax=Oculatella sp. LEGE 06141 TaxID=1828648 RepID=UPI00187F20D7|nr:response regulator [Oculatella sp. LEGE 06141]MBE9180033.1 response regulator [Oculatella sp. LEGE 06141]
MDTQAEISAFIADILIVDDKLENIRFLSEFLSEQRYQVRKAINGQAALTAAKALPPDLILLDINMPVMGGYEVCQQLKDDAKTSSIPIIFLSAGNEVNDKVRAFQVGGVDYITKPFQLEEVLARVQTQLSLQTLQKQLQTRNDQLQEMVSALQKAQANLVQQEKLIHSSRIAAGISHEINNPLCFILGNLVPASDYSQKLINLIQLYQEALPVAPVPIKKFSEEIELDFLKSDFTKVIDSIQTGAERIRSVVQALQTFSRLDESGIKPIQIHQSVESALTLLRYQFTLNQGNTRISIAKNYEEVPLFWSHATLFNQALFNLLQNAIDAVTLKANSTDDRSFQPTLWISISRADSDKIKISIKDNGVGISPENEAHLFEPFFTTKPGGQGVGLGLFTSYQIITGLHKGQLTYQTCLEHGSEFVIEVEVRA